MRRVVAQAFALVLFVFAVTALEENDLRVAFESEDVRRDAVEEPTVVRDDYRTTCEIVQTFFQRTQRVHVDVVGRFVEQQYVALLLECEGQVQAVAFPARQYAALFLLVRTAEVEPRYVSARIDAPAAELDQLAVLRYNLVNRV